MTTTETFTEKVGDFLRKHLPLAAEAKGEKVIHDPLWGSNVFFPWELAIIDTPLFQRLRFIHQTGTAFLTYPSSAHNRFSHSLGVCILANRLILKLKDHCSLNLNYEISKKDIYTVRLAGLLHDVGHCFFSHTSEQIIKHLKDFHLLRKENAFFSKKKVHPHESYAFLILRHPRFGTFWDTVKSLFKNNDEAPELGDIARIIIGSDISPEKRFLREIITGPYDVDKLEYLYRDGYNAGLTIAYDIERYFYRIQVEDTSKYSHVHNERRLVMDIGGVTAVEQLIFSKMMLFSYIYHHQKVRPADCIIRDIVYDLLFKRRNDVFPIGHPVDFVNYTDADFMSCFASAGGDEIGSLIQKLRHRNLLKRCFVITRDFVEGLKADQDIAANYERLCNDMRDVMKKQRRMREHIAKKLTKATKRHYDFYDIQIDLPELPPMEEAAKAPVKLPDGRIEPISDYFQLEGWERTYELKKLRGYFFVRPEVVNVANTVIKEYLQETYNLSFNPLASQLAKVV
jgi:HD superfamily phosphohydrolase